MERLVKSEEEYRRVKRAKSRLTSSLRENGLSERGIDSHPDVRNIYSREMALLELILSLKEGLSDLLGAEVSEQRQQLTRILEALGLEVLQPRASRLFLVHTNRLLQDYDEEHQDPPSDDENNTE